MQKRRKILHIESIANSFTPGLGALGSLGRRPQVKQLPLVALFSVVL